MMILENILSQEIVQRLGWTLLHFVWQAAVVALLLMIFLAAMRKSSSNMCYTVGCMALGLIVLLPVVTFQLVPVPVAEPSAMPSSALAPVVVPTEQVIELPAIEVPVAEPPVAFENAVASPVPSVPWWQQISERLESILPHVVSLWLIGVFALSIWHLGGWTQLQRLRRKMVKPVDESLRARLDELAERLGVKRAVALTESALIRIPTVVGSLCPVVLLPASALTGLTTEQLDAILAHELAHIRRHDYLVNILQTVVETLGFYHPAVWWVSHKVRTEREHCCDDLAIVATGDRVRYARALTLMEEIRSRNSDLALTATGGNLFSRISRLIGKDSAEKTFSWIPAVTGILLIVALIISTTLAVATNGESAAITNKSENEELNVGRNDSSRKVLIETQVLHVSNEFLEEMGLDVDSLKNSNSWTQHRVDDSNNPSMFVMDSNKQEMLLKNVYESEASSSVSRIYMMGMSGREATIKKNSGYKFKSKELGRFIKLKPTISQDGQSTYLDCKLMMRQFKDINLFLDVFINKKVDQNDVSESEIVEDQTDAGNILLSDDNTMLILGGKLVSWKDVENGAPVLRKLPLAGRLFGSTSKIRVEANEMLLIKVSTVPTEQNDDVDSRASAYTVANYNLNKVSSNEGEFLRVYLDLHLEPGQYVEIKNIKREQRFQQIDPGDIGKGPRESPTYLDGIHFEIRSNFDLNLATKRHTRNSFIKHNRWRAYFNRDTIAGNGHFSKTVLLIEMWKARSYAEYLEFGYSGSDLVPSLVAVIIKPIKDYDEVVQSDKKFFAGLVVDKNDLPVPGVRVKVCGHKKPAEEGKFIWRLGSNFGILSTVTDSRGRFTIEVDDQGFYNLLFSPKSHAALIEYEVPVGKSDLKITLPEGGTISGRVVTVKNGKKVPLSSVQVNVRQVDRNHCSHLGFDRNLETLTDRQGRFQFDHLRTKVRSDGTLNSEHWEYSPRSWRISHKDVVRTVSFHAGTKIEDVELSIEPDYDDPDSLIGKPLQGFHNIKIGLDPRQTYNRRMLVCFWDMNQLSSRNCIIRLSKRSDQLKQKGVGIIAIQTSIDAENTLNQWMKNNGVDLPLVGTARRNEKRIRFDWGCRSLPWLILTDRHHIVRAEGFGFDQIDVKLGEMNSGKSAHHKH